MDRIDRLMSELTPALWKVTVPAVFSREPDRKLERDLGNSSLILIVNIANQSKDAELQMN